MAGRRAWIDFDDVMTTKTPARTGRRSEVEEAAAWDAAYRECGGAKRG